jgi:hypothetical protein
MERPGRGAGVDRVGLVWEKERTGIWLKDDHRCNGNEVGVKRTGIPGSLIIDIWIGIVSKCRIRNLMRKRI